MNQHPFPNSDKLYILPCIQEKQATGGMDKENIPGRPSACFQDAVDVSKKMNNSLAKMCVGKNIQKPTYDSLCTYDNALEYVGNKRTSCSPEIVWNYITDFINRRNYDQKPESTKNFFVVSHHNTLKQSILANILKAQKKLTKEKFHIANCSCFMLEYTDQGWTFSIVFDGFPDKPKYNYFTGKNKILFGPTKLDINIDSGDDWKMMVTWLNFIQDKKTKIFLIRHGNAFHNKPLKLTGPALNRTIDTNLTPLGIYQARVLGETLMNEGHLHPEGVRNINTFCASYMNRAQHTALELIYALNINSTETMNAEQAETKSVTRRPSVKNMYQFAPVIHYKKLSILERFFTDFACSRLIRKSGGLIKFLKNVEKLAKWDMNFKVNENGTCEKLMPQSIRRCSYIEANSHMMSALQNIAKYSMEEWDAKRFCKSYAISNQRSQLKLNPQEGSGKKKTKRRTRRRKKRRRKKQKTKKRKRKKRKN